MNIIEVQPEDFPKLFQIAREFTAASKYVNVDTDVVEASWNYLYEMGAGRIFAFEDFSGAIGCLVTPDINSGELTLTEAFWFVLENHRGKGVLLLKYFEEYGKALGCSKLIMVHMLDLMPEKVRGLYTRFGYTPMEVHYIKEI